MMLDELVDMDEERLLALEKLIRQKECITRAYNKKEKFKVFSSGDYIWKVILPMDQKDRMLGKWSPNWEGPFRVIHSFSNNTYEIEELEFDHRIMRVMESILKRIQTCTTRV